MVILNEKLSFILVLMLLPAADSETTYTIHVDPQNGTNSSICLTGRSNCASLSSAVCDGINSSTTIVLANGVHFIDTILHIHDVSNVTITFQAKNTTPLLQTPVGAVLYCNNGSSAGIKLLRITNLNIYGIKIENCGALVESTTRLNGTTMAIFRAAVYILNSTNVIIESSTFVSNRGWGLVLYDTNGSVSIQNSNFTDNIVPEEERLIYNGGGGLYIEHTYCTPGLIDCDYRNNPYSNDSVYAISGCHFVNNHATTPPQQSSSIFVYQQKTESRLFGAGGGLQIVVKGISSGNRLLVNTCHFENNSAEYGGGIDVFLQDYVRNNELCFQYCIISNNHGHFGGGGVVVGVLFFELDSIFSNNVTFTHAKFTQNFAPSGGGTYMFTSRTRSNEITPVYIQFIECTWYQNSGTLGSALMFAPDAFTSITDGYLPVPNFTNCTFERNRIIPNNESNDVSQLAVGILFSSTVTMTFSGKVIFVGNIGTAFSITTASVNILQNAVIEFTNNSGVRGGALALNDFASLKLHSGAHVSFINNYASELGGAIYATAQDELDYFFSRSCFIRYEDVRIPAKQWKVNITFENNLAGPLSNIKDAVSPEPIPDNIDQRRGFSVFSITILPCIRVSDTTGEHSLNNTFPHDLGDPFTFNENCHSSLCSIATAPASIEIGPEQLDSDGVLRLSPGQNRNLSLTARDDLNHTVSAVVTASVFPPDIASVDSASIYITDGMVQINGMMHAKFTLTLRTAGKRQTSTSVQAMFIDCPPGFIYQAQDRKCVCSAAAPTRLQYLGIARCDIENFHSSLSKRYWAGCDTNDTLLTAVCPAGYCRYDDDTSDPFYTLPQTCQELEKYLCGPRNRKGRLCGQCANKYTVFFHSEQYNCKECKYGYIGWLLYILSELLPVTVVFLAVVLLNVHLTAGLWNSIILYAQIIDFIGTRSIQSFEFPRSLSVLTSIYRLIYGSFNLDFFKFEDALSFCLWNGATAMDVLVFRYLTAAYAILLLVSLLLSFKTPCWNKCQSVWERGQAALGRSHHKDLITHGISAFLVLSYAFCVKVSFQLLTAIQLHGQGHIPVKSVVLLSGDIDYFSVNHLPYALPAILVLILTTLPPVVLILYPNGLVAITKCIGEQRMEKFDDQCNGAACTVVQKTFRISRFKPVLDSFQGCFKDRFRFFAGMFFLYRFLVSLIAAVATDTFTLHATSEILIVFMLAFHAFCQPYHRPLYNHLDTFMFANLAIINALYLYDDYSSSASAETQDFTAPIFQLVFVYLPLITIIMLWVLFGVTRCSKKARYNLRKINQHVPLYKLRPAEAEEGAKNPVSAETPFDQDHLPHRMFEEGADDENKNNNDTEKNS